MVEPAAEQLPLSLHTRVIPDGRLIDVDFAAYTMRVLPTVHVVTEEPLQPFHEPALIQSRVVRKANPARVGVPLTLIEMPSTSMSQPYQNVRAIPYRAESRYVRET